MPSWSLIVLAHWNNSPQTDMSLHSGAFFWIRANQSLFFLLSSACLVEKQRFRLKPRISFKYLFHYFHTKIPGTTPLFMLQFHSVHTKIIALCTVEDSQSSNTQSCWVRSQVADRDRVRKAWPFKQNQCMMK